MTDHAVNTNDSNGYTIKRYEKAIQYYWRAARRNKLAYQWFRYLTIVFSAVVSLAATLSSTDAFGADGGWVIALKITTPVIATLLTILTGFAQTFQWGASWRESVMTASRLERELDRIRTTPLAERDMRSDLKILNRLILTETDGFFDRLLGRTSADNMKPKEEPDTGGSDPDDPANVPA